MSRCPKSTFGIGDASAKGVLSAVEGDHSGQDWALRSSGLIVFV